MSYQTILVHCELGKPNTALLQIAGSLAERFDADVIGIAACQPLQLIYDDGVYTSAALIDDDRRERDSELRQAEAEYHSIMGPLAKTREWRSTVTQLPLAQYVAQEARCADLIVTGVASSAVLDQSRRVNTDALIMQAGRPVLVVAPDATALDLARVVVAWKDTREARRAVLDAVPLLQKAGHVSVLSLATEPERDAAQRSAGDVVDWLARHGVVAEARVVASTGKDGDQLDALVREQAAGLTIAGAYGHSRLREWALGGMTRAFLARRGGCFFLSH